VIEDREQMLGDGINIAAIFSRINSRFIENTAFSIKKYSLHPIYARNPPMRKWILDKIPLWSLAV